MGEGAQNGNSSTTADVTTCGSVTAIEYSRPDCEKSSVGWRAKNSVRDPCASGPSRSRSDHGNSSTATNRIAVIAAHSVKLGAAQAGRFPGNGAVVS